MDERKRNGKNTLISGYTSIIKSRQYSTALKEMAGRIIAASKKAPNEATIESRFDCELFAFFKEHFGPLGFEYNPIKEKSIATCRHVAREASGRADTAISTLVIEFKQPAALAGEEQKNKAINQISDYLIETVSNPQQSWGESCTQVAMNKAP